MAARSLSVSEPTIRVTTDSIYAQYFTQEVLGDFTVRINLRFDPVNRELDVIEPCVLSADQMSGIIQRVAEAFRAIWNGDRIVLPFRYRDPVTQCNVTLTLDPSYSQAETSESDPPAVQSHAEAQSEMTEEHDPAPTPAQLPDLAVGPIPLSTSTCCILL